MSKKAKTNWHLVIWPILILWGIIAIYIPVSEFRSQSSTYIPILMGAAFFLVFLANAILGSHAQHRLDLEEATEDSLECKCCGDSSSELHIVDYEYLLAGILFNVQYSISGKYCHDCAREAINGAFRKTLFGSFLCPPVILFAWLKKKRELRKLDK